MEYISLIIAALGFAASVYYSNRSAKKQDEDSMKKEIEAVKKETAHNVEINMKLDSVLAGVRDTGSEIKEIKKDLNTLAKDYAAMSRDVKTLFDRTAKTDQRLEKLHNEFREHVGVDEGSHHMLHSHPE